MLKWLIDSTGNVPTLDEQTTIEKARIRLEQKLPDALAESFGSHEALREQWSDPTVQEAVRSCILQAINVVFADYELAMPLRRQRSSGSRPKRAKKVMSPAHLQVPPSSVPSTPSSRRSASFSSSCYLPHGVRQAVRNMCIETPGMSRGTYSEVSHEELVTTPLESTPVNSWVNNQSMEEIVRGAEPAIDPVIEMDNPFNNSQIIPDNTTSWQNTAGPQEINAFLHGHKALEAPFAIQPIDASREYPAFQSGHIFQQRAMTAHVPRYINGQRMNGQHMNGQSMNGQSMNGNTMGDGTLRIPQHPNTSAMPYGNWEHNLQNGDEQQWPAYHSGNGQFGWQQNL